MDKKSKVFFWILAVVTLISVSLTFYRAFYTKDYEIIPVEEDLEEEGDLVQ